MGAVWRWLRANWRHEEAALILRSLGRAMERIDDLAGLVARLRVNTKNVGEALEYETTHLAIVQKRLQTLASRFKRGEGADWPALQHVVWELESINKALAGFTDRVGEAGRALQSED